MLFTALVLLLQQAKVTEVYTVDDAHSILDFTTRLVAFNRVRGSFTEWSADFAWDPERPMLGVVSFVAKSASISTQVAQRDRDLKAPDFFDAARFPTLAFQGHVAAANGTHLEIEGRLTIRDSSRTIRFPAELEFPEAIDPFGNRRLVFSGKVTLNRRDFGVVGPRFWNLAIADSVTVEMELAGRIWGYTRLGVRPTAYYGPALLAAADSGRFDKTLQRLRSELAAERDSTRYPGPFEFEVTAGRLTQAGKAREAKDALELVAAHAEAHWSPQFQSGYQARLGEAYTRLGQNDQAKRHFERALALDSANTNARVWLATVARTP
jgi:polyisoprenoid-binding protein YceI